MLTKLNLPLRSPMQRGRGKAASGFTLIELMVVIAIIAILAALAAPSFNESILGYRLTKYANAFSASARLARSEAIKRNAQVTMCRSSNGTSCAASGDWQQGWIVFDDKNGDGVFSSTAVAPMNETLILWQEALPAGYLFYGNNYKIDFPAIGAGTTAANLVLCKATPSPGSQERAIKINVSGYPTVTTTKTGTCVSP